MSIRQMLVLAGAAALVTCVGTSPARAQTPSPTTGKAPVLRIVQAAPATTIEGELVRVDTTARLIVVRTAEGKEEQLAYTDTTKVSGTRNTVAGLATTTPTQVSVRFTGSGANRVATEIRVRKAES